MKPVAALPCSVLAHRCDPHRFEFQTTADLEDLTRVLGQERAEEATKARDAEEKALEQLQALQKKMNDGLDNLQALTLSQRLKKLSESERGLSDQLGKVVGETIGMLPRELPERAESAIRAPCTSHDVSSPPVSRFPRCCPPVRCRCRRSRRISPRDRRSPRAGRSCSVSMCWPRCGAKFEPAAG